MTWRDKDGKPWSLMSEYYSYLTKISHVSSACLLSVEEESLLQQQIPYKNRLIFNRSSMISSLRKTEEKRKEQKTALEEEKKDTVSLYNDMQVGDNTLWMHWENWIVRFFRYYWYTIQPSNE